MDADMKQAPLSSATLHILLALAKEDLHGYGIIKEVVQNSDGHYRLGPGTLYDNLKKLMAAGLVADATAASRSKRNPSAKKEEDLRLYSLTAAGRGALAAEVERLQGVLSKARLRLREAKAGRA
jgi:DNA-binding PadR family transcriptional regulator